MAFVADYADQVIFDHFFSSVFSPILNGMKWIVMLAAIYFGHLDYQQRHISKGNARAISRNLASTNVVEIYSPKNCGGSSICRKQVADIKALKINYKENYLTTPQEWEKFQNQVRSETGGGPKRMPAMKVNGKWLFGAFLSEVEPHLIKK